MSKNGSYWRLLSLDRRLVLERIFRKQCRQCRATFSLLPDDVVPLHSYGRDVIADRLVASLRGLPLRSRDFYEEQGLLPDDAPAADEAWTDWVDANPLAPTVQTLGTWGAKFGRLAENWLRLLLWGCIYAGAAIDTRFAASLAAYPQCPKRLHALALSAALMGNLLGKPIEVCLRERLGLLACRPSSHKTSRAFGRPPPQYGGSLEGSFLQD